MEGVPCSDPCPSRAGTRHDHIPSRDAHLWTGSSAYAPKFEVRCHHRFLKWYKFNRAFYSVGPLWNPICTA